MKELITDPIIISLISLILSIATFIYNFYINRRRLSLDIIFFDNRFYSSFHPNSKEFLKNTGFQKDMKQYKISLDKKYTGTFMFTMILSNPSSKPITIQKVYFEDNKKNPLPIITRFNLEINNSEEEIPNKIMAVSSSKSEAVFSYVNVYEDDPIHLDGYSSKITHLLVKSKDKEKILNFVSATAYTTLKRNFVIRHLCKTWNCFSKLERDQECIYKYYQCKTKRRST